MKEYNLKDYLITEIVKAKKSDRIREQFVAYVCPECGYKFYYDNIHYGVSPFHVWGCPDCFLWLGIHRHGDTLYTAEDIKELYDYFYSNP